MLLASSLQPESVVSIVTVLQDKIDVTGKGYNVNGFRITAILRFDVHEGNRRPKFLEGVWEGLLEESRLCRHGHCHAAETKAQVQPGPQPLCTYESTYLGHLFYAEQPGQLQAQHLEAGLGRLEGNNGCQSPGLTQSSAMALGASGQWVSKLLL